MSQFTVKGVRAAIPAVGQVAAFLVCAAALAGLAGAGRRSPRAGVSCYTSAARA